MARVKRNTERVRLNLEVSPRFKERLLRLRERMDADTMVEVVRRAVERLERQLDEQEGNDD